MASHRGSRFATGRTFCRSMMRTMGLKPSARRALIYTISSASRTMYAHQTTMAASAVIAIPYRISERISSLVRVLTLRLAPAGSGHAAAREKVADEGADEIVDVGELPRMRQGYDAEQTVLGPRAEAGSVYAQD